MPGKTTPFLKLPKRDQIIKCMEGRAAGKTNQALAAEFGCHYDTIKNRFREARSQGLKVPDLEPQTPNVKVGGGAKDRKIVELADEIARLKTELMKAHREALAEDAVKEIIGILGAAPCTPPSWTVTPAKKKGAETPQVPVTAWADWHGAETVSYEQLNGVNEFNLEILETRVRRLVERTISLARDHGPGVYPGIIVNLLGDFVSGGLHPELLKTDEEAVIPTALRVRDLFVWGLGALADEFGRVYAPAVCGNHGRNTARPEFKNYVYENFDWLIYQMTIRAFQDRKDDRIVIDTRPSNEVHYRVFKERYLAMHGDMMGVRGGDGIIGAIGPIMRGEIKVRGWADSSKRPYDMLVIGHYHQPLWLPRAVVANTLKGYCEYAKNQLRAPITEPSQPLWFVHPKYGITSRWEIKVNEYPETKGGEWVAVFDPVAA